MSSNQMVVEAEKAEAIGRSAMRKATWRLIPLIALGYGVAYMDRVNISFAQLQMNRDLHFSATVYGAGAGLFFLSYAICEIPSNILLYRIGARRWLARIMITWGLLAIGMMFVRTPVEFYAMRFLLGVAEAGFFPGVLYYLTHWFPAEMRARTISRFYVALPLSSVVMGGLAGYLLGLQGTFGLAGWQWLFLLEGLPAVLLSVVFLRFLPDSPRFAAWLDEAERDWIGGRLVAEGAESGGAHTDGFGDALQNPRVWLFGVFHLLMLGVNYGYGFSAPVIVQNLTHLDTTRVGYMIAVMGLLGGVAMLWNAWLSDRVGRPYRHIVVPVVVESLCLLVVALVMNPWIAVPVIGLMIFSHNAMQGPLLALPSTFLKGRSAAAGLATINMVGMLGGVIYPPMMGMLRDRSGNYQSGLRVLSASMAAAAAVVLLLRYLSRRRQRIAYVHP